MIVRFTLHLSLLRLRLFRWQQLISLHSELFSISEARRHLNQWLGDGRTLKNAYWTLSTAFFFRGAILLVLLF